MSRRKTFIIAMFSSVGSQVLTAAVSFVSVSMGLRYFGSERYGIWLVLITMITYLNASQFGIGLATSTLIAKANYCSKQQDILSISFLMLCFIGLIFIILVFIAGKYPLLWLPILGRTPLSLQQEAVGSAFYMSFLFFMKLPTVAFTSALTGLQQIHWERIYTLILPAITGFIALLLTIWVKGDLIIFSVFTGIGGLIAGFIGGGHVLLLHRDLSLKWVIFSTHMPLIKLILHSGWRFFVIGLAAMIVWNTDNLVINYFMGPQYVSAYAITFKLFSLAYSILFMINSVLWPMYGKALVNDDWGWLKSIYDTVTMTLPIVGGLIWIGGILFAHEIIQLWVGPAGYGGPLVVFAFGGYGYLVSLNSIHSGLLSGMNATANLLKIGILEAVANLGLSLLLVNLIGVAGAALGTFLSALVTVTWLLPCDISHQTNNKVSFDWKQLFKHTLIAVIPFVVLSLLFNGYSTGGWSGQLFKILIIVSYLIISCIIMPKKILFLIKGNWQTMKPVSLQ